MLSLTASPAMLVMAIVGLSVLTLMFLTGLASLMLPAMSSSWMLTVCGPLVKGVTGVTVPVTGS